MIYTIFRTVRYFSPTIAASFLLLSTSFAYSAPKPAPPLAVLYDVIAPQIHRGNVAIYFAPFHTQGDDQVDKPDWWKQCTFSRFISERGMKEAGVVNRALQTLNAPIGIVASSQLCVALSTATFVVGNSSIPIVHTPDLNPAEIQKLSGLDEGIISSLIYARIETGMNDTVTILSGFRLPIAAAPHPVLADLQSGESAIFKRLPNGEIALLARLNWTQWGEMADYIKMRALAAAKKGGRKVALPTNPK